MLLQEHWLHNCDKNRLQEFLPDFNCYSKCYDDNVASDPIERGRGKEGVAICVKKKYSHLVEQLPDGGNRIIAIKLKTVKPVVIICVYLPSRRSNSADSYQEILDELCEIKVKYGNTADIIFAGDMNTALIRHSFQDKLFQ